METQNAFIGHTAQPTPAEIDSALGKTASLWRELIDWVASQGVTTEEWKSTSPKYGWSLRLKLKKRTIVYLGPCGECFRVAFVLGDKAAKAARESKLPIEVMQAIDSAPRYAEGTGVVLHVKKKTDLAGIKELVHIKLAN
jgi:Protein of unknown function (DUF3788)